MRRVGSLARFCPQWTGYGGDHAFLRPVVDSFVGGSPGGLIRVTCGALLDSGPPYHHAGDHEHARELLPRVVVEPIVLGEARS